MMGPFESLTLDPSFDRHIVQWLEAKEKSLISTLRAYSRRWNSPESSAVISNADGGLQLIEHLRKHINSIVLLERANLAKSRIKEVKSNG